MKQEGEARSDDDVEASWFGGGGGGGAQTSESWECFKAKLNTKLKR